jgi:Protein of unknown function (DUF2281)
MLETNAIDNINSLLSKLPESLQIEALHYVEYLTTQSEHHPNSETIQVSPLHKTRSGFGILKGKVTIADDFDAPLDEFADYQ